jgi:hypothetical protein
LRGRSDCRRWGRGRSGFIVKVKKVRWFGGLRCGHCRPRRRLGSGSGQRSNGLGFKAKSSEHTLGRLLDGHTGMRRKRFDFTPARKEEVCVRIGAAVHLVFFLHSKNRFNDTEGLCANNPWLPIFETIEERRTYEI